MCTHAGKCTVTLPRRLLVGSLLGGLSAVVASRLLVPLPLIPVTNAATIQRTWEQIMPLGPPAIARPIQRFNATEAISVTNLPRYLSFGSDAAFAMSRFGTDGDVHPGTYTVTASGLLTLQYAEREAQYAIALSGEHLYLYHQTVAIIFAPGNVRSFP